MNYEVIIGDLVALAKDFEFDVVAHGVNCQNTMKRGLAPRMAEAFHCDQFTLEKNIYKGDINKLGQIDYTYLSTGNKQIAIVNCYIQYNWSTPEEPKPINYNALKLCLQKLNHKFKGQHIGLPGFIGGGLAGGDPILIEELIKTNLKDCNVTVVKLP